MKGDMKKVRIGSLVRRVGKKARDHAYRSERTYIYARVNCSIRLREIIRITEEVAVSEAVLGVECLFNMSD
jgi:hypothetical protein